MPLSTVLLTRLTTLSLLSAVLITTGLSPGARRVQAEGVSPATPSISLTVSTGTGGYSLAANGSGFAPDSTITLAVDGSSGPSCKADATCSFSSCAFTPPT